MGSMPLTVRCVGQRLAGASLLIFANKTDVEGCMSEREILTVSKQGAETVPAGRTRARANEGGTQALQLEAIRTHQWHVLPCSAMTGRNLKEGLAWVVEDAKKRLFLY
jgi:ADP-ribosylation factor-like protein 2